MGRQTSSETLAQKERALISYDKSEPRTLSEFLDAAKNAQGSIDQDAQHFREIDGKMNGHSGTNGVSVDGTIVQSFTNAQPSQLNAAQVSMMDSLQVNQSSQETHHEDFSMNVSVKQRAEEALKASEEIARNAETLSKQGIVQKDELKTTVEEDNLQRKSEDKVKQEEILTKDGEKLSKKEQDKLKKEAEEKAKKDAKMKKEAEEKAKKEEKIK